MKTMTGTMYFNPLEGGVWAFEDEDGTRYQLEGIGPDARGEGRRITIHGDVDNEMMGIAMLYPIFRVESYTVETPVERKRRVPVLPPPARPDNGPEDKAEDRPEGS